jgi:sialic acid synthase SpsE
MLSTSFPIAGTKVGLDNPPYVIAEAGSNFNQSMDIARRLIDVAVEAGADAIKFQLFRADILYPSKTGFYDLFKSIELNPDWVPQLMDYAKKVGIHFTASAFDFESISVLEAVGAPFHKIASSETSNLSLVHRLASTGKPVAISTGMCDMVDVEEAVNVCRGVGNDRVILMQCGTMYPLPAEFVNLRVLKSFADRFGGVLGFSDHTLGSAAAAAAVGIGATVFEKHFTLDRNSQGPDHAYAIEPEELKTYVRTVREAYLSLGSYEKEMLQSEREGGRREGLYAARELVAGERLSASDIVSKRPAVGLRARYADVLTGAVVSKAVAKDQPITWDVLNFDGGA